MTSRDIFLKRKLSRRLSLLFILNSAKFRSQFVRLLPVLIKLIALVSLISLAATFHAQLTPAQTANLPSSGPANNLTSKSEIIELRSAYANHYDLGDDRRLAVVGTDPLNYQDANGSWQPIQPAFAEVEGGWRVTQNTLRSAFANDNTAFQIESGGYGFIWQPVALEINDDGGLAWQLAMPQPGSEVQVEVQDSLLRYASAWSDPSLVEQFRSASDSLEQELVLANPPAAVGEGEWLSLRVDLSLPNSVQILAEGEIQTGEFTTHGALQLQGADGATLLTLLPPRAYEEKDPLAATGGRYRVLPQPNGLTLWVQTPLDWWLAAERDYPAVLDPTMQVLRPMEVATIGYPYEVTDPNALVWQEKACVGLTHIDPSEWTQYATLAWSDRGYVKFKLPNLPDGALADQATLVAAPDPSRLWIDYWDPIWPIEDTLVYRVTQDWSFLEGLTTLSKTTVIAHAPTESDRAQIPHVFSSEFDPHKRPVTQWDVTSDVQGWYQNPTSNYGFALISEFDGHHLDPYDPQDQHSFPWTCFPKTSMGILDDVLANPGNPTVGEAGIGLLIEYTSPQLTANELRTVKVPSAYPGDAYEDQHHEYVPPATSGWQLMAARGVRGEKPPQTRLQLTQVEPTDPDLDDLVSNNADLENEIIQFKSEYVVANGHQSLPADLRLHVLEDTYVEELTDDNRMYHLQTAEAAPSPTIVVETTTTIPMPLASGFIVGQELDLSASTTVEIKVPYGDLPAEMFNLQLFPPGLKYGSRNLPGIQLTEGPDAWEIEMVVPTGQAGTWLLAAINDGEFSPPGPTLNAEVLTCQNTAEVIKYPVNGFCVELQTPPSPLPSDPSVVYQNGNVRIYSPLGFTESCDNGTCTTVEQGGGGQMVMALIGYVGDDDNWVAVKGGQFSIVNDVIHTTPDARLIMARFNEGPPITLPVLRGLFQVNNGTGVISSFGADPNLLIKNPLPDDTGWTYTIELSNALMRAEGPLQRIIEPTQSPTPNPTTFNFNAQWSITARGGQDLAGETTLANSPGAFNVGTLIVDPASVDAYSLEYNPADILPGIQQAIPEFLHIRLTNAALKQPINLGGTQVPVQALILNPGKSVMDDEGKSVVLYCGTASTCFDLRGEADTMTPSKQVDRGYRMPDLIIQDQAGTVMINTPQGVEIYSKDHPMSQLREDESHGFSYEAFGATIKTYQGVCPLPNDPLNPGKVIDDGTDQITTVVKGSATLSVPNAESTSGGPQIGVSFTLCENSLRKMGFIFSTGDKTALPLGNSGLFMNLIEGEISLAPEQGPQPGYTTVTLSVGIRGMSAMSDASNIFVKGTVTIDTRGLFDMQLQAGLKVVGGYGVGVDGHFWVAWSPLDLGFDVQACAPYSKGFDAVDWSGKRCSGNELLFGSLRAHIWQGQGWQHKYNWLPDNDDMHIAARYTVSINIATGMIVDTAFVVIPPTDIQLFSFTMAFGEFCTNNACTSYEWGVTGAYTILGYDFGIYYGFDSGLDFILGSGDYLLIDEAGGASSASSMFETDIADRSPYTVNIPPSTPSAMFTLGWDPGAAGIEQMELSLQKPDGTVIDQYSSDPKVTVTTTPTSRGEQTVIVVEDPEDGDWQIFTDSDSTPLPPHTLLYVANKPEPTLILADIPYYIHPGDMVTLEWMSNISEHDTAWLSLYYTTTNAIMSEDQEIGGPIVERLPLTPSGSYQWHVKGLAYVDNEYHIYARIDSEATAEINACGESYEYNPDPASEDANCAMLNPNLVLPAANIPDLATFWYEDEEAPASPTLIGAQAVDWTSIMVLWKPNADVDIAGYLVRCTQASEVRTVRVPAQHMAGIQAYESAQVNGLRPYQTATCSLRAYDTSGNISGDSASVEVVPDVVISEATISPENGAILISVDEKITATFPMGIVESDTDIQLITRSLPPHPVAPLAFTGTGFNLSAYGPSSIPVSEFLGEFTLEVSYGDLSDTSAGRVETLNLYWWDGETWQGLLPCEGCYHDVEEQRFVVILDHLTEFAVLAGEQPDSTITIADIPGVTPPATGGTPVTVIAETAQYTGTVSWLPADSPFLEDTIYTATITLTPKAGYTLMGVTADFFKVSGATTVSNAVNSGVVTAAFPTTDSFFQYLPIIIK